MTGPSEVARSSGSPIRKPLARSGQALDNLVIDTLLHQHARAGRAHLPRVEEDAAGRGLRSRLDVRIIEDDVGRLATELKRHPFEVAGRALHDAAADAGRAGERNLVDIGMIDQRLADRAPGTGHDVENAGRQTGFEREIADPKRRQRGQLGGLHHDGAAAGQRRRELPHPDHQREVPRHDRSDDADGLEHRVGQGIVARGHDLTADLVGPAGVICECIDRCGQILAQHGRNRLAGIEAFELDDLVGMITQQLRPSQQDRATLRCAHRAPRPFESTPRRCDGTVDILGVALGDRRDRLLGGRIERHERAPRDGGNVPAVDQELQRLRQIARRAGAAFVVICNGHHISSASCMPA